MKSSNKNSKKIASSKRRGQGLTEYIILVGLVAVVLVGAVTKFKTALGNAFDASTKVIDTKITKEIK